nr:linker for activation of T-cells family member 2 isoform X3 [Cavia porcellus]
MGNETELLWPGAALLLLLLGAVAGLCVRCSRPGKRISRASQWLLGPIPWSGRRGQDPEWTWPLTRPQQGRTNCCGSPPCRTVSVGDLVGKGQAVGWPVRSAEGTTQAFLPEPEFARYQNFSKGSRRESDAYIDPIVMEYYNWGCSWKPPEDEDDTNSYENVLLCGPRSRNTESGGEDSEDYQNSVSIHQWHKSMQAQEQVPRAAHLSPAGSPDEDEGEPDYVNGDVAAREA